MIEKLFKHEITKKRWRRFVKNRRAVFSSWLIIILCFFSFTAEFWANSKPIVLSYQGKMFFPTLQDYSVKEFGDQELLQVDYRKLKLSDSDWAIWPLIKWDPFESNKTVDEFPSAPSSINLMGTDDRGRDILSRLLYGFRYSIIYSVSVWVITFFIGTVLGALMGYIGGRFDFISQRIVEILSTVPQFFLLIILIAVFQPSLFLLVFISSIFGWISISYYIRGEFLKNRKKEYVEAAKALGNNRFSILFKHILPNSLSPLITFSPFVIAGNITALAGLDYLGFGLMPPTPSWGELLSQAQKNFTIGWWLALFPSMALFFTLTFLSLIGEGVRDAMDPHLSE
ncbi:ABC transporter permease subunit [Bacteriovoracaceae bacterium]|nr:ABC transporter permease subunit [Bacteriovoracaceae bacterium]